VLRAVVLTQYRRVTDGRTDGQTDGQTDGIAVASTALAIRALRRAVKNNRLENHAYFPIRHYSREHNIMGQFSRSRKHD